jgi:hypothetical protein
VKTTEKHLGTGLTRRRQETKKSETFQEVIQLFHEISYSGTHPFEDFLNHLSSGAENELRKRNLPYHTRHMRGVLKKLGNEGFDSRLGYSARILRLIANLRGDLKRKGTNPSALHFAYQLGVLHQKMKFKFRYETATLRGAKSLASGRFGGHLKAANDAARLNGRNKAMAAEFAQGRNGDPHHDAALKRRIGRKQNRPLKSMSAVNEAIKRGSQ